MNDAVVALVRFDRALHYYQTDFETRVPALLAQLTDIIDSVRRRRPNARLSVVANPLILSWAMRSKERCPAEVLSCLKANIDSGFVDVVPSLLTGGLDQLARCTSMLHFNTLLRLLRWPAPYSSVPNSGVAGVSIRDFDVVSTISDDDFEFAVCDVYDESPIAPAIARMKNGTVSFQYPVDEEMERGLSTDENHNTICSALFHIRHGRFSVEVVPANDLPNLVSTVYGGRSLIGISQAVHQILPPPLSDVCCELKPSREVATFNGIDVNELIARVEDLFVKLISDTFDKSISMFRDKLLTGDDTVLELSAINKFLILDALMDASVSIRLNEPVADKSTSHFSESRERVLGFGSSSPQMTAVPPSESDYLTERFLDVLAQSFWLHGLRCHRNRAETVQLDADWLTGIMKWLETSLCDTADVAVANAPGVPTITNLQSLREGLSWNSLRWNDSILNSHINILRNADKRE